MARAACERARGGDEANHGGATITIRFRFADGQRAVFKPEQTHSADNYRAEIAAYHVDRLLGFDRTAAVAGLAWLRQSLATSGADAHGA